MEISKELFERIPEGEKKSNEIVRPSETYFQDAWRRLKKNKLAIGGLIFILLISLAAIVGPMISKYDYSTQNFKIANQGPSAAHWFGTDKFGRDLFIRVLCGARVSLAVGVIASILNLAIGVVYGGISGYFGGAVDNLMMRIVDVIFSVPMMIYVILLSVALNDPNKPSGDGGIKNIIIAMAISFWVGMARIVRSQIISLKEQEYVLSAKISGGSHWRILFRHLIPNSMGPIIVTMTLSIPSAIFTEAFLSFIGLGVSVPKASWGSLCSDALGSYTLYPSQLFFPALAICLTILAFNFLGDGLRDALDPKMRK